MRRITCLAVVFFLALTTMWGQEKVYLWKNVHSMRNERSSFFVYAPEEEIDILEEAGALKDISHMPARVKCAVLGWRTLNEMLWTPEN